MGSPNDKGMQVQDAAESDVALRPESWPGARVGGFRRNGKFGSWRSGHSRTSREPQSGGQTVAHFGHVHGGSDSHAEELRLNLTLGPDGGHLLWRAPLRDARLDLNFVKHAAIDSVRIFQVKREPCRSLLHVDFRIEQDWLCRIHLSDGHGS